MAAYVACKCHTLLLPSGTYNDPNRKHLFIVCTDACKAGNHVIVSVTEWQNHLCDGTTRLAVGDHPFITKDSYIFYRKARIESGAALAAGVASGLFVPRNPASDALVAKILKGICDSIQTPRKVKKYA